MTIEQTLSLPANGLRTSPPRPIQVGGNHYSATRELGAYDTADRWSSYHQQITEITGLPVETMIEIGPGTGLLKWYLETVASMAVTTVDFDPSRKPDVVCDVANLEQHFDANAFDAVVAFQVLEHIPFAEFEHSLHAMLKIARKYVILSLPVHGLNLNLEMGLGHRKFRFSYRLPRLRRFRADDEHHWEVQGTGTSLATVRQAINRQGRLIRDYFCDQNSYHRFFVIEPQ